MTASEERTIGRLTRTVGWGALCLLVAATIAAKGLKDTADDARDRVAKLEPRVERLERRSDSLLIELRHLPDAVADTLAARERRGGR